MEDGFLDRIRSVGHWRVNFRPISAPKDILLLGDCNALVKKAQVSVRGWDFPNIRRQIDNTGGYSKASNYVENWTEYYGFIEFWRMYSSTQFLSYVALREDTMSEQHENPQRRILMTSPTIYQLTEIVEFCNRLFVNGIYREGVLINLSLINTKGRILRANPNRMPFFDLKEAVEERIDLSVHADPTQISEDHRSIAINLCVRLFDQFGWNPDRTQLQSEQERYYAQELV